MIDSRRRPADVRGESDARHIDSTVCNRIDKTSPNRAIPSIWKAQAATEADLNVFSTIENFNLDGWLGRGQYDISFDERRVNFAAAKGYVSFMAAFAAIIVHPVVLYGVIGCLLLWAIISGTLAFRAVTRLSQALVRAHSTISAVHDALGFTDRYETISRTLQAIDVIGPRWRDFRETLLIPSVPNRPVRATEPAEHWFNQYTLTEAVLNQRYHAALPGLLVGAGLLFTFLGLAAALSTAGGIVAEGIGQTERNQALKTLLDTASFKFLSSVAGLFLSICYTIFWKVRCQRRIGRDLDSFLLLLEERIVIRTSTAAQNDVIALLERQLEQTETFSNTLAVSIGTALDQALDQRLGDHIGPLARAVEQLAAGMATQNQDAVAGMLDEFLKKLNSNAGDSMKQAADRLAGLGTDLAGLKGTLNEAADRMTTAADGMSSRMGEGAEQALSRITAQFERMIVELQALSEASRKAGSSALTELGDRIAAAAAGFETSAIRVAEALAKSATDTGSALGAGAEDAVRRIADATEGMRVELRAMLVEFRETLGRAGEELRKGGEQGSTALTGALGSAGDTLADAVRSASEGLRSAGDAASLSLRQGGESAGGRIDHAAGEIGSRAATLAREMIALTASLEVLPIRIGELEQAAGRAAPPLTAGAADLRAAAEAARHALQPLQDTARTVSAAADQLGATSRQIETVQTGSRDLSQAMTAAAQRFEGVDRALAVVTKDLQEALRGFAQQVSELVQHTNSDMAKSVGHLDGAIRQLEETLEDRWPRPAVVKSRVPI